MMFFLLFGIFLELSSIKIVYFFILFKKQKSINSIGKIFSLDVEGNVNRIRYNVPQRDTFFSIDVEQVDEWYAAMKLFIDYMYKEAVYFKTEPGANI